MYDRADLYIPFIERSLPLLAESGTLGFICADRWMKNRYGGPLRKFIAKGFHLKAYVDMDGTNAFHSDVSAYPAITVITKSAPGPTRITHSPAIYKNALADMAAAINLDSLSEKASVREIAGVVNGSEPWLLESSDQIALIRGVEKKVPTLEQAGCKVGIGVATGTDKAFNVVSDTWDLRALQAVLLSSLAKLFVATYSTKMRGGYIRFQAQYLRRIRIPFWQDVSETQRRELIHAAQTRNLDACNKAVFKLYKLNQEERAALGGNGE